MKKLPILQKKEKPLFKVELQPTIPEFPDVPKHKVNIRYPLIAPYSYAHIFWDNKSKELIYYVEEPVLNPEEKNILNLLEEGIKELINISYLNVKKGETLIVYLEKNLKVLLNELRIEVSKDSYLKLMYFIYRDFVGLNEVEPLLCDYFIEDIECNGVGLPIYIVHRKYRNVRTNVEFDSTHQLASFVEKLAQKCGQYVSYANPLLDGALPDGSRVNATFTEDISSRGPTFTIRKFTRNPWTPTQLMYLRTASPEILAYLWLLIEYERNIMVIGGTGSGKTTFLNGLIFFIPPSARVVSIEDSVTGDSKIIIKQKNKIKNITIKEFVDNKIDAEVMTLNEKGKIIFTKPSSYIKHKVKKEIYEILTSTGRRINVTKDHSLFTLKNKKVTEIKPIDLQQGKSFIAVPRILPLEGKEIKEINLLNHLNHFNDCFLLGEPIKKVFEKYKLNDFGIKKERYAWWKKHNLIKIKYFKELNINFTDEELKQLKI
ncbi:MAG: Flp pilus assembly complex ATPase component TadA, partial [Nanoarchaeota archaeon]|nr:Flp pilus assembly complex ATPase component TadA [Nanoarchaeota archaeon]